MPPYTYTWSTGDRGPQATARWTNEGRHSVRCTVADSRGNQATSNEQIVSVTIPSVSATFETLDPNPGIPGNVRTTNPVVLISAPSVTGIAADGATLVLLRFTSNAPGSVKFSLNDTSNNSGLSVWGAEDRLGSITQRTTAVGSRQQAFAVYHAPSDFSRTPADYGLADRPITLRAQFTPDIGAMTDRSVPFTIVRPPLVLIHGIWPGNDTWTFPLVWDTRFRITKVSWDGYTSIANNSDTAKEGVQKALEWRRSLHIAATRVDVIAHSMGGLLARAWAGRARYNRADNYDKGDYHTLITLNTPHTGSPLAKILIDIRSNYILGPAFTLALASQGKPISTCGVSRPGDVWRLDCPPGAIDDLQVGSPALTNLARPRVPTHAFVGGPGISGIGCQTDVSFIAKLVSMIKGKSLDDFSMAIFGELTHDQIVGSLSQSGGLAPAAIDQYLSCGSAHTNATTSRSNYSTRIALLLNQPVSSPAFSVINDEETFSAAGEDGAATTSAHTVTINASSIALTIDSPHEGTIVDGSIPLTVRVSASGPVTSVTLLGDRILLEKSEPPFEFTVNLPDDALGHETFVAAAVASDGTVAISAPVGIEVRRNTPIESLQLDAISRALLLPGTEQLHVSAIFSDGVLRDVTDPAQGTTYTSGDESIVSVSPEGVLTARGTGVTVVTVRNGAAEASTFVLVAPTRDARRRPVRR